METKDLIIVGAGPAGLSAAIYATRYRMNFEIIGRVSGGLMSEAYDVENYPGFEMIQGNELGEKMTAHLKKFGKEVINADVAAIEKKNGGFLIKTAQKEYATKSVLLAIGTERNKLNIPGEKEFAGKGVSYCATCDGFFFRDKVVAVVGGGDAALGAAVYLSDLAKKVYLIHRRSDYRADPHWQEKVKEIKNITEVLDCEVKEIMGTDKVEKIRWDQKGTCNDTPVDGIFIEIGETPQSVLLKPLNIDCDKEGFVKVHPNGMTSVEGIWAAGDLTTASHKFRQIVTAAAEGALCAVEIFKYLKKKK